MRNPIICIPRISKTITMSDIKNVFDNYNFGNIQFRNAINDKQEIKIFHSFPNFWKCYKSFSKL